MFSSHAVYREIATRKETDYQVSDTSNFPETTEKDVGFESLGLTEAILQRVRKAGFVQPTQIQARFIPECLAGKDVLGQAKTGTGKTAAFLLPAFKRLRPGDGNPSTLILAPTRELALQIEGEIGRLGEGLGFSSITIYGGASYEPQIYALKKGVDLVVGTPGRVMDHMRSGRLNLSTVRIAVLDEADRMLDLGFRKDIEYILKHCPKSRQTMLLSATIPNEIRYLAKRFMRSPIEIYTAPEKLTVDQVEQFYTVAKEEDKWPTLLKLLDEERPALAIIFCQTKRDAKKLAARLKNVFISAREIHGDLVQAKREKIMKHFRKGRVQILVATDVASRGIDVDNITHIINYNIPYKPEDYVHRIGRTGRMDREGKAFTLCGKEDAGFLTEIEMLINREIIPLRYDSLESHFWPTAPNAPLPEFAPDDDIPDVSEQDYIAAAREPKGPRASGRRRGHKESRGPRAKSGERARSNGDRVHSPEGNQDGNAKKSRRRRRSKRPDVKTDVTCAACGNPSTVSFKPDPKRPVYCDDCYAKKKSDREPEPAEQA